MRLSIPVLTWHSQNIEGHNDHEALVRDLPALHRDGWRIISLAELADRLDGKSRQQGPELCLSFDDGCDFDVRDLDYPGHGVQRSFLGILQDFVSRYGPRAQPGLHATSFVIASPQAREIIDARSLFGKAWMSDDWWGQDAMIGIGNHGWDHNHPDLGPDRGGFTGVTTEEGCRLQVEQAAAEIERRCGYWPAFYAYPFGESSAFMRERYFPTRSERHRCRAAFGTDPGFVTRAADRWNLPRFVCGRDWHAADELLSLLRGSVAADT